MPPTRSRLAALLALLVVLAAAPAQAQGLGLGINVAGVGVNVGVGGDSGPLNVNVGAGGDNRPLNVSVNLEGDRAVSVGGATVPIASATPEARPERIGQRGVLEAVRARRALPLEDILMRARMLTDDQIIDAQLIGVQGTLLYQLKLLGKSGDVSQLYLYARSGLPVQVH